MILHTLQVRHDGAAARGVLQRILPVLLKEMLTQTLRVGCRLTSLGRRLVELIELLYASGRHNADALDDLAGRRRGAGVIARPERALVSSGGHERLLSLQLGRSPPHQLTSEGGDYRT